MCSSLHDCHEAVGGRFRPNVGAADSEEEEERQSGGRSWCCQGPEEKGEDTQGILAACLALHKNKNQRYTLRRTNMRACRTEGMDRTQEVIDEGGFANRVLPEEEHERFSLNV